MDNVCEALYHGVDFDAAMTQRGGLDGMKATNSTVIRDRLLEEAHAGARIILEGACVEDDKELKALLTGLHETEDHEEFAASVLRALEEAP